MRSRCCGGGSDRWADGWEGRGWVCGFLKVRPWAVFINTDTCCFSAAWVVCHHQHRCGTSANQSAAVGFCFSGVTCIGQGMTNKQASWEHKPLLFLQATNSEVTPPTLALHSTLKLVTWHVRTLSEKPPHGTSLLYYRLSTPSPHSACFLSSKPEHFWSVESEDAHKKAASQQAIRND